MMTIKVHSDAHGLAISSARATRYLSHALVGTVVETAAIRETVRGKGAANLRAPSDWPKVHGTIEARVGRTAR